MHRAIVGFVTTDWSEEGSANAGSALYGKYEMESPVFTAHSLAQIGIHD